MIRWTARHPVVPIALIGIFLCLGGAGLWRMPVDYLIGDRPAPLWASFAVPGEPGREVVLDSLVRPLERRLGADTSVARCRSWIGADWAQIEVELSSSVLPDILIMKCLHEIERRIMTHTAITYVIRSCCTTAPEWPSDCGFHNNRRWLLRNDF